MYKIKIEVGFRSAALPQTVLESGVVGRIVAFGESGEIRFGFVVSECRHNSLPALGQVCFADITLLRKRACNPRDQVSHGMRVAPESGNRCRVHLISGGASPIDTELGMQTEFTDELTLCSSVAFPEWMDRVKLSQVVSGSRAEFMRVPVSQVVFGCQFVEELRECLGNKLVTAEPEFSFFPDIHHSKLPGPGVDILKDVVMNSLQMSCIEGTSEGT